MALIRIDATGATPVAHGTATPVAAGLERALNEALTRAPGPPVVLMVHGFRFRPGDPLHCPHRHILSDHDSHPCRKAASWPRGLGVGEDCLGLAFGWDARGTIWQAYDRAEQAGLALARVVTTIRRLDPGREIHAIGHSLGARVLLAALAALPVPALGRVLLLAGADHASHLHRALASPAGRRARLLHVTSGENLLFDMMLAGLVGSGTLGDPVLGQARHPDLPELRLDDPQHLAGLAAMGFSLARPDRRICHWSTYLRPGTFPLYRALTGPRGAALHAEVTRIAARRPLPARTGRALPLPWGANASS
ncbi:alpha/beta hydrolase [Oceanicola sp. S124]|uniref:alpha/beta hydrolase n=1 Tax=Oceanicola sp. S124 TaxID=1042378 RepID=UPI0002558A06|nr:alpha/beta hydrolase [Oceanicola sp. S124]